MQPLIFKNHSSECIMLVYKMIYIIFWFFFLMKINCDGLSGAHTVGLVRCSLFRARIYNETNIDPAFDASMQEVCPFEGGDNNFSPFDVTTPFVFDNAFYKNLVNRKGLVHSDQQLFVNGSGPTDSQVTTYSRNMGRFKKDFANAMFKMSMLTPLTGSDGQIRKNCRVINDP